MKVLLVAAALVFSANSVAGECTNYKEVHLPQWIKQSTSNYTVYVSNISEHDVDVEIKFFDSSNVRYKENSETGSNFSFDGSFTASPAEAPAHLASGNTGRLLFLPAGSKKFGYAKISWSANECLPEAIQASAAYWTSNYMSWLQINGGAPF